MESETAYVMSVAVPGQSNTYSRAQDAEANIRQFGHSSVSRNHSDAAALYQHWIDESEISDIEIDRFTPIEIVSTGSHKILSIVIKRVCYCPGECT